jgi:hypothetical protein
LTAGGMRIQGPHVLSWFHTDLAYLASLLHPLSHE